MNWLDETRGIRFELLRHFLSRMFSNEFRTVAVGLFSMAVPAGMLLLDLPVLRGRAPAPSSPIAGELAVLTLLAAITGVMALLAWQSLFPSRRDFVALAGFPARPRQIFLARFLSVLLFALIMVTAISFLPSLIPPHFFTAPQHGAFAARFTTAVFVCLFTFFAVVAIEGLLLNLLPVRLFMPVSTCVQGALTAVFFLAGLSSWFIVDWKPATIEQLPDLQRRYAVIAFAAALAFSILMYLLSYRRHRKLLLETPDVARPMLTGSLLRLIAGGPRQEAIMQFLAMVLARSRTHRLTLMAYAGAALGIMINSVLLAGFRHGAQGVVQFAVLYWPLGTSFIMLAGIRHVFSLPADLPSNWLFQITESQGRRDWMSAIERFVVVAILAPIYLISTPVAASVLDLSVALRMTPLQVLVALITFDLLFNEWQQLPFACSYVPGKRPLMSIAGSWIAVLGVVTPILTIIISTVARMPELFLLYGAFFAGDWIWARRRRREGWGESRLIYEDRWGAVTSLGIAEMTYRGGEIEPPESPRVPDPPDIPDPSPAFWMRLKALVNRRQLDQDLEDELQFHLAMNRQNFGNVTQVKEQCREQWTWGSIETFWQDLRYGARQLRRAPGFTAVAALTLALGIGATTAVYSMCETVLWRPVALPRLESLVMILQSMPGNPHLWSPASPADIADIAQASTVIEGLASWSYGTANIVESGGEPVRVEPVRVTANFFSVLGVQPARGRAFVPGDERAVILSDGCWRRRFAADAFILGKSIWLNDRKFTVIGVMPEAFAFPRVSKELWTPLVLTAEEQASRDMLLVDSIARLRPGRTIKDVAAELDVTARRLESAHPDSNQRRRFMAWPVQRYWTGDYAETYSQILLGAAIFVLLICCANVANLQFARISRRGREIAIRTAIGAGRMRVIRQLITESLLLAGLGTIVGLPASGWVLHIIKAGVPAEMRQYMRGWAEIGLNLRALLFALIATLLSGVIAGLAPAWRISRPDLAESLKEGGSAVSAGPGRRRIRTILVAGEVALATALLSAAGLMVESFRALIDKGASLEPDTLLTLRVSLSDGAYRDVMNGIAAIPGVRSAAAASALPHSRHGNMGAFEIEGRSEKVHAQVQAVSANYFDTLHVALQAGRFLAPSDGPNQPRVAVISQSLRSRWLLPVGRRIRVGSRWITIVGVVADIETPLPTLYLPYPQSPERDIDLALRTSVPPMTLAPAVRAAIRAVDSRAPITNIATMRELIHQEDYGLVYGAALMGAFGGLALALSFVGVYGLLSYLVSERTREIGVRMALGASPRAIVVLFCRDGFRTAAAGLAVGFLLAFGLERILRAALFGVASDASMVLWSTPLALAGAVALAIYIPARRATRVDPVSALREE